MKYCLLAIRICVGLIFLKAGISHLGDFDLLAYNLGNRLYFFTGFVIRDQLMNFGKLLTTGAVSLQLAGSLSFLLGYKVRISALLLMIMWLPSAVIFSNVVANGKQPMTTLINLISMAGLLMLIYKGSGAVSLDKALEK